MTRNQTIDIAKGIAIICVIIGHCPLISPFTRKFIYSFHMPLFFIMAGYFYHEKEIGQSLGKDFKRLLVPYIVFASIYAIKFSTTDLLKGDYFHCINNWIIAIWGCGGNHTSSFLFGNIKGIGFIWFLPAMYWCKNLYNILSNYLKENHYKYPIICFVAILAMLISNYIINMPFGILTGASAMIFYAIGNIAKKIKCNMITFIILCVVWIFDLKFGEISVDACKYNRFPLEVFGACGGTMFVYIVSKYLIERIKIFSFLISWTGKMSMIIFCTHYTAAIIDVNTRLEVVHWSVWLLIDFTIILTLSYICTLIPITRKLFQIK